MRINGHSYLQDTSSINQNFSRRSLEVESVSDPYIEGIWGFNNI